LGGEILQNFKFTHYLKKATNYAVKVERVDNPGQPCDFKAEVAQVTAAAAENNKGIELQAAIKYEPFTIGDSRGVLKLTSPEGIEYTCMLYGKSIAPQPQGPVRIQPGKPEGIEFKNPLNEKQDFIVTFDNQNFTLQSKPPQGIDPGKPAGIQVKFEGKADLPNTGRMIITAKGLPPWIYYLVGGAE
jgi:hydrocephalus-inducing protein